MVGGAQEEEVGLAADQLDEEGRGTVLFMFAVEAEHAFVGIGLGDGHQRGIAQVFADEQEEGRFGLYAAALLVILFTVNLAARGLAFLLGKTDKPEEVAR